MQDGAGGRYAVAQDVQDVLARLAVVHDDGKVQARGQVELVDEEFDLAFAVAVAVEIVQADFAHGDDAGQLDRFFYRADPVLAGVLHLGRRNPHRVMDMLRRLEVVVDLAEVHEAVADADQPGYTGLFGLLANHELFDRVIVDEPDVGVSVEIPHLSSVRIW